MTTDQQPKRDVGRPPLAPEERKDVEVVTVRIEGADRRAKFKRLGRKWLERAIDRAREVVTD